MCDCNYSKACKLDQYLDTKNCSYKKRLISKLVLACEDEVLKTIETSLDDKKIRCEKNNCLIHTISLVNMYLLLLAVVYVSYCYYYTKDWIKKENLVSY